MSIVNDRIKRRRLQLGYTLLYISEQLGVKEATVQRYESGEIKNIKHETIVALSEILDCDPAYLMGWLDTPFRTSTLTSSEKTLLADFRSLNDEGQQKLLERAKELKDLGYVKRESAKMA